MYKYKISFISNKTFDSVTVEVQGTSLKNAIGNAEVKLYDIVTDPEHYEAQSGKVINYGDVHILELDIG